jgi:hypothetical protein
VVHFSFCNSCDVYHGSTWYLEGREIDKKYGQTEMILKSQIFRVENMLKNF